MTAIRRPWTILDALIQRIQGPYKHAFCSEYLNEHFNNIPLEWSSAAVGLFF
jgi:hypothetical protein